MRDREVAAEFGNEHRQRWQQQVNPGRPEGIQACEHGQQGTHFRGVSSRGYRRRRDRSVHGFTLFFGCGSTRDASIPKCAV